MKNADPGVLHLAAPMVVREEPQTRAMAEAASALKVTLDLLEKVAREVHEAQSEESCGWLHGGPYELCETSPCVDVRAHRKQMEGHYER